MMQVQGRILPPPKVRTPEQQAHQLTHSIIHLSQSGTSRWLLASLDFVRSLRSL